MKNLLILLLIFFVACKGPSDKPNKSSNASLEQLETQLDSLFNAHVADDEPGAALLVSYDGKMLIGKGYGLRDLETKSAITKSTNMRMASVSKQFTALTVLCLVDQGTLSLSDSVYSIYPFETFKDGTTIEQLINHTSGEADAESAFFTEWDSTKVAENSDILNWYKSANRTLTIPGENYKYNNGIYELIPMIVEKVSGQDFATFAKEQVFEKAGMVKTNFFNLAKPIDIEERAYCYEKDSTGTWKKMDGFYLNGLLGAGGVYASVNDYFQYDQALRNKSLFSEQTHDIIFKPSASIGTQNGEEVSYAMGWNVSGQVADHTGSWIGTNTWTKRYLDKPLTLAIFMNRSTLFNDDLIQKVDSLVVDYINGL